MKNKKYIILFSFIIIYLVLIVVIKYVSDYNKVYIFFTDNYNIEYDGKWKIIDKSKLPNKKYIILKNGKYYIRSKVDIFDNISVGNEEFYNNVMGIYGHNIKYMEFSDEELSNEDNNFLSKVLLENNINISLDQIPYIEKKVVDLNNDGINESVYSISNNYDINIGQLFSLVVVKNNNDYVIIEMEEFESEYESYLPYLYFVNLNKDNDGEIIIKNTYSSLIGQKTKIISINKDLNKYKIIYEEAIK